MANNVYPNFYARVQNFMPPPLEELKFAVRRPEPSRK
jgi:hypothetical protein